MSSDTALPSESPIPQSDFSDGSPIEEPEIVQLLHQPVTMIIDDEREAWFRAADVARAVKLDEEKKYIYLTFYDTHGKKFKDIRISRPIKYSDPEDKFFSETSLYAYLLTCQMPITFNFIHYVMRTLKTIRKDGLQGGRLFDLHVLNKAITKSVEKLPPVEMDSDSSSSDAALTDETAPHYDENNYFPYIFTIYD